MIRSSAALLVKDLRTTARSPLFALVSVLVPVAFTLLYARTSASSLVVTTPPDTPASGASRAATPPWKWTGFTGIEGCGFDTSGNFYSTEFQAHGMFGPDPAGDVVKVSPSGQRTTLGAGSLFFPSGFAFHNGGVYVSNWSIMPADNSGGPTGEVVRIATN